MLAFEYRHVVGFEETNLVATSITQITFGGKVGAARCFYGACSGSSASLAHGFALVTTKVSCEYLAELVAFDELIIRMRLGSMKLNRIDMLFEYWRCKKDVKNSWREENNRWRACIVKAKEWFRCRFPQTS